jgi:hypothetical protein
MGVAAGVWRTSNRRYNSGLVTLTFLTFSWRAAISAAAMTAVLSAGAAAAQETRTALIAQQQADKAAHLHAYEPSKPEQVLNRVQSLFAGPPSGPFPAFGSVYGGGGVTLGAGYRKYYADRSWWEVKGLYSIKNYKLFEVSTTSPGHLRDRLVVGAVAGWRDAPRVGFYGLGTDTDVRDRANFELQQAYGGAWAQMRPVRWVVLGENVAFEDFTMGSGAGVVPSIEERYTALSAPGLGASPSFVHAATTAGIDTRPSSGYARRGGYYGVALHNFVDPDDIYSFNRADATVVQHIPILRETWVLSLRGNVQTTLGDNDLVPYFLLPSLGSGSTLRGYHSYRFRDRHSLLTSAEWRFTPSRLAMDVAVFVDAGKVVADRGDLDFKGLVHDVGLGVRFHAPAVTILRTELAKGREGWRLVFAGSPAF